MFGAGDLIFPVLSFLVLLALNLAHWLVLRRKTGATNQRKWALLGEIAALRKEAERHNTPATFARCAKFQRQAGAKEKELESLAAGDGSSPADRTASMLTTIKALLCGLSVMALWGRAIVYLPPEALWPLGSSMAAPHVWRYAGSGAITVIPWLGLCNSAGALLAQLLFPPLRATPLPAKAGKQS